MHRISTPLLALRLAMASAAGLVAGTPAVVLAQAAQPDQQEMERAGALVDAGKYQEAAELYGGIETRYPTSPLIPQAVLRLGYVHFRTGEYDKALERVKAAPLLRNVTPDLVELAQSLLPQILSARAGAMKADDPGRQAGFTEAVKEYDVFLQKFPQSAETESANYGKGVALYQLARYEEAIAALRQNLQRFPKSENVLDSQYLLALSLGTWANVSAQKADAKVPATEANYDLAEKTLNEIIAARSDVALANDARFQIGELLFLRAGFLKDEKERNAMYRRALEAYRQVTPKEQVIVSQKARIESFKARRMELLRTVAANPGNLELGNKRMPRLIDREQEKLAAIEARPDQTLTARLKSGEIYFHLGRPDEARTVLNFVQPFLEEDQQKKERTYYTALSFASQNAEAQGKNAALMAKTEEAYTAFVSAYKGDPVGENLAVVVGVGFVQSDPEKALKYFRESAADYPTGHFRLLALTREAAALEQLKRYDEAVQVYEKALAEKPAPDMAASAEFGLASVRQKMGQLPQAIAAFKQVRDKYPGTEPAEQAAFWHGQLLGESGDSAHALTELRAFIQNYPKSELLPSASYYLAAAQAATGKPDEALATYRKVAADFPKSQVAPFSYLQRGQLLMGQQKFEEVIATMRELIQAYPEGEQLFQAYDLIAQIYGSQQKTPEQIAAYEEFIKAKPEHPNAAQALLRISSLWKDQANRLGRFVALSDEQKGEWKKDVDASIDAAVRLVTKYPESEAVALGLNSLLEVQKLRQSARLLSEEEVQKYFTSLAEKFADKPGTRSKVLFVLASYVSEKDKAKASQLMREAYDERQKYAPGDLDLYGASLIEQKKYEEARKVYAKLAQDYPLPPNAVSPEGKVNAPQDIQEAQAIILFGMGKILQEQKKEAEAGQQFAQLEKLYGWSPKNLEGSYGIAVSLYQQKSYAEALKRLVNIIKASTAPADLRAKSMLLLARSHEDQGNFDTAIDNYIKIGKMFAGVPAVASEGLWRGANLLERQGKGELPMPTPVPRATPAAKKR